MQQKLITLLDFSIYFFLKESDDFVTASLHKRKSKQKASSLSNRFAFKVVRDDISLINRRCI